MNVNSDAMLDMNVKWHHAILSAKCRTIYRCCYNSHISIQVKKWIIKNYPTFLKHGLCNMILFIAMQCHFKNMHWTTNSILAPKIALDMLLEIVLRQF